MEQKDLEPEENSEEGFNLEGFVRGLNLSDNIGSPPVYAEGEMDEMPDFSEERCEEISHLEFSELGGELFLEAITSEDFQNKVSMLRSKRSNDQVRTILGSIYNQEGSERHIIERGFAVYTTPSASSVYVSDIYDGDEGSISGHPITLDFEIDGPEGDYFAFMALHHEPPTPSTYPYPNEPFIPSVGDLNALRYQRQDLIDSWGIDCRPIMVILRGDDSRGGLLLLQEQSEPHPNDEISEIDDYFNDLVADKDSTDADYHMVLEQSGYNVLFIPDINEIESSLSAEDLDKFRFTPSKTPRES